jgi:hypothetical protein
MADYQPRCLLLAYWGCCPKLLKFGTSCPSFLGFQIVLTHGGRLFDNLVLADTIDMYSCRMSEGWEAKEQIMRLDAWRLIL